MDAGTHPHVWFFSFFAVSRFAVKILHTVAGLYCLSLVLSCLFRSVAGLGGPVSEAEGRRGQFICKERMKGGTRRDKTRMFFSPFCDDTRGKKGIERKGSVHTSVKYTHDYGIIPSDAAMGYLKGKEVCE